jgi:hypothetical protein
MIDQNRERSTKQWQTKEVRDEKVRIYIYIYNTEITDDVGREELMFLSFCFVVTANWDLDRRIVGALLIVRDLFVVRTFESLSSIDIVGSRFISIRVLLRRIGSSYDA